LLAVCAPGGFVDAPPHSFPCFGAAGTEGARTPFKPDYHVNYTSRVVDVPDGTPKFVDMPVEAGGSGATVTE
jgi:hypothetical protein